MPPNPCKLMTSATIGKAANILMNRRFLISSAIALGAELAARSSEATPVLTPEPSTAITSNPLRTAWLNQTAVLKPSE